MKAWQELIASLEPALGASAVEEWLRPIVVARFDAANIYLEATPFQKAWFEEHVRPRIKGRFLNNNSRPIQIHWEAKKSLFAPPPPQPEIRSDPLDPEFTLETFLPQQNEMGYKMAQELLARPAPFNPVFYYGPSGSGKTHLLTALAQGLALQGRKVFYSKASSFAEQVVAAIRASSMLAFRNAYRDIDALLLDDIHFFSRKSATQEEFFHTFNTLHTLGKQIVLSANKPPSQLEEIEPRLISRFEWGITLPLSPPTRPLMERILAQKLRHLAFDPHPELIALLLERLPSQPILALHAFALRAPKNTPPREALAYLSDFLAQETYIQLTPERIVKETAAHFGIRADDLLGKSRLREFAQPRHLAIYLCRTLLHLPLQTIGRLFQRDHSTILSSIAIVEKAENSPLADAAKSLLRKLH